MKELIIVIVSVIVAIIATIPTLRVEGKWDFDERGGLPALVFTLAFIASVSIINLIINVL